MEELRESAGDTENSGRDRPRVTNVGSLCSPRTIATATDAQAVLLLAGEADAVAAFIAPIASANSTLVDLGAAAADAVAVLLQAGEAHAVAALGEGGRRGGVIARRGQEREQQLGEDSPAMETSFGDARGGGSPHKITVKSLTYSAIVDD